MFGWDVSGWPLQCGATESPVCLCIPVPTRIASSHMSRSNDHSMSQAHEINTPHSVEMPVTNPKDSSMIFRCLDIRRHLDDGHSRFNYLCSTLIIHGLIDVVASAQMYKLNPRDSTTMWEIDCQLEVSGTSLAELRRDGSHPHHSASSGIEPCPLVSLFYRTQRCSNREEVEEIT